MASVLRKLLFVLLTTVILSPLASAQSGLGTIEGRVTSATGPVNGAAAVVIVDFGQDWTRTIFAGQQSAYSAITDRQGAYSIPGLKSGRYLVTVSAVGYKCPRPEEITVTGGSAIVNFALHAGEDKVPPQSGAGVIQGAITSAAGPVDGAIVTISSQAGGWTRTLATDQKGSYFTCGEVPGIYTVSVTAMGFKTMKHVGIFVVFGGVFAVDFKMEPGAQSEVLTDRTVRLPINAMP